MLHADEHRRVGRALAQLPPLRAPHTLLPRVMAAVQAWALKPWYQRAWFTWPLGWQLAALASLVLAAASAWWLLPGFDLGARLVTAVSSTQSRAVSPDTASAVEAIRLAFGVVRQALQPVFLVAFVIVVVMASMCLGAAMALNRLVFGRM